jgi:hypothetical protein
MFAQCFEVVSKGKKLPLEATSLASLSLVKLKYFY